MIDRETPTGGTHQERLARLREVLRDTRLDGLLITHLPNIRYLSGFTGSTALLLVLDDVATLITDFRYEGQAGEELDAAVAVRIARDGLTAELRAHLEEWGTTRTIGFEMDHVSVRERRELGEKCDRSVWEGTPAIVEGFRSVKDPSELERITRATEIAARAWEETLSKVAEGVTERELAAELDYRLRLAGSEPPPFETIVAAGPRSALPHARPSGRKLQGGDLLLFDFGARVDGYCCDVTRTVVLGSAARWQREIHEAVQMALEAALGRVGAEVPASQVDEAARGVLEAAGLSDHFGHSTGHGLGLEVHEAPRLHRHSEEILRAGNVVTVEPGVYLAGRGGVRIEEDVAVEPGGARLLTRLPRALRELS